MRFLIAAFVMFPMAAMAQTPDAVTANYNAEGMLIVNMVSSMTHTISDLRAEVARLQAQHDADQKALAAAKKPTEPAKK